MRKKQRGRERTGRKRKKKEGVVEVAVGIESRIESRIESLHQLTNVKETREMKRGFIRCSKFDVSTRSLKKANIIKKRYIILLISYVTHKSQFNLLSNLKTISYCS